MANDLDRILALPRRDYLGSAPDYTERFRVPGGTWVLNRYQNAALAAIEDVGGGLVAAGVGIGKTLVAYLAPRVAGIDPSRVLVLAPAEARTQYRTELEKYARHFDVAGVSFRSYSELSRIRNLDDWGDFDMIVCDEVHKLKNRSAGRTMKFGRALRARPDIAVIGMSASLAGTSVHDYAHISEWALGDGSPLPLSYSRLDSWSRILDSSPREPVISSDWWTIPEAWHDDPREAYAERFASSPGVVVSTESSCDQPITFEFDRRGSDRIDEMRRSVMREWAFEVDGDVYEIDDPLRLTEKLRQVAMGFVYYPIWPDGEPDYEWLYARNELSAEIRRRVKRSSKWDTRGELLAARERGEVELDTWSAWAEVADRPEPERGVWWFDGGEWLSRAVADVSEGLIWCGHRAVRDKLATVMDSEVWEVPETGTAPVGDRPGAVLSIASHGTALNLQQWNRNFVLCPPANGGTWEQMIGRTHRQGQDRPVSVTTCVHTPEMWSAWKSALRDARYVVETQRLDQKVLT